MYVMIIRAACLVCVAPSRDYVYTCLNAGAAAGVTSAVTVGAWTVPEDTTDGKAKAKAKPPAKVNQYIIECLSESPTPGQLANYF